MRYATKHLLAAQLHTAMDPAGWMLLYMDGSAVDSMTNIVTTDPDQKALAITMLEGLLASIKADLPVSVMKRIDPESN